MNLYFWWEALVRSTALLVAGAAVLKLSRSASPAVRHRCVLLVLLLLSILPLLVVLLPQFPISIWKSQVPSKELVTAFEVSTRTASPRASRAVNWPLLLWAAGAILGSLPLLAGSFRVRRLVSRAKPLGNGVWASNEISVPITAGVLRPKIVLPSAAEHWPESQFQAALAHERAHIRRHDLAAQLIAHFIACLWWFQPLAWWLRRALRTESEYAADAEAIRSGIRPSDYAGGLLAIASTMDPESRLHACTLAMARSSNLEHRVRAALFPEQFSQATARTYALGFVLAAATIAASAASFSSGNTWFQSGGSTMKNTLISALFTSAALSAATVSGTVHDVNGAAVADANVTITNPDTSATQENVTGADGKFTFNGSGAGQYILHIEKPGFASIFQVFDVKAESTMDREFTLPAEGAQATTDNSAGVRVGGEVAQNNLIRKVQPVYPKPAKLDHIQGTVEIQATISKDGVPIELQVTSSPDDSLSESALEAVRQWRYRPTLLNGEPVQIVTKVIVNYTLSQ